MARVCVLGPVELLDSSDSPVPLAPRMRRLLAALTVRSGAGVAGPDWLAEAVWGDATPEHPANAVQTLVSRLRAAIRTAGGGLELLTRPEGYALRADIDSLDVLAFRGLLARARAARRAEDRIAALVGALSTWRGEAYGVLAEESFARESATALTEQRAAATVELAEAELAAGQPSAAQERLSALIAERPYDERPALLLMATLSSMGRVGDALGVYADLRRRLRDDLGLEPSAEAAAVQRDLLRPRGAESAVVGLPGTGDVLGRAADERALAALLRAASSAPAAARVESAPTAPGSTESRARLVTVLGPGGVGKTTLAVRVARLVAEDYADGVLGVELGRLETGDDVAAAVGTVLRLPTSPASPTQRLIDRLRDRELLLLLDNCEHLVAETARVVDRLLASCPGLSVLATSRVTLRLGEEHVFRLGPLDLDAAIELYRRRARQRVGATTASMPDQAPIGELCRRLDLLPLAVELAASRADVISAAELLDRWSWHRSMLRGGSASDPRHRSLTALIDWSYERLPAEAQRAFDVVSVFAGDFSLGDAADLLSRLGETGDPGWSLTTLVDSSMVNRSPATGRLRLLETVRAYGRARLADTGRAEAVSAAHAGLFVDRAVAGRGEMFGPGQPDEVRRLLASIDELRTAFGWALPEHPELAVRLAGSVALLVEQAMVGEAVGWADAVVDDPDADGWVYAVAAAGARFVGDLDRAADLADRAADLAGEDSLCRSHALLVRSDVALFLGDAETVEACRDRATEPVRSMVELNALLIRQYGGTWVDPTAARNLGQAAERRGRTPVAAWARYVEGELLLGSDPATAYGLLTAALDQARTFGDQYLIGVALVSTASAALRSGRLDEARELFAQVIRHWQQRGDRVHQWTTLRNVVELLAAGGQPDEAVTLGTALLVPERGAAGYGEDEARLAATVERLRRSESPDRFAELQVRARGLRDDQVISLALQAL